MSFNPFDLLGVTIDSTPDEARASFRELALLAHPDKGGRPDDMRALLSAYRYVLGQLEAVNRTTTVEDLEARFAAFCAAQTDEDLDLRDPALRALVRGQEGAPSADCGSGSSSGFDADGFNAHFERAKAVEDAGAAQEASRGSGMDADADVHRDVSMSTEASDDMSALEAMFRGPMGGDGYGASMAPSEYAAPQSAAGERRPYEPPAYRAIGTPAPPRLPERAWTSSTSFAALPSSSSHGASTTAVALWSSLSARKGGAGGTDYVEAFGAAAEVAEVVARYADAWESGSVEERLEAYKTQCGVGY